MEKREKFPKKELESQITEEKWRSLDIKTVKDIQKQFGISYEGLKKFSKKEIEILAEDAKAIKEQLEKRLKVSEEQRKEQKIMAKDMYERLLRDAEESGDEEKIKIYQNALKAMAKENQE